MKDLTEALQALFSLWLMRRQFRSRLRVPAMTALA